MGASIRIGLIGDFNPTVTAHQAIPEAVRLAGIGAGIHATSEWVPTEEIDSDDRVASFDGLWCVPASPYRSMEGALRAIRFARTKPRPYLGTCGGFQHAVVEYARNVLGWSDADHAESSPATARPVIAALRCALVEASGRIRLQPGSRIAAAYGTEEITEQYHCSYGLNPDFEAALASGAFQVTGRDPEGGVRAMELTGHPFFVATLFQPERSALRGVAAPPVLNFVRACAALRAGGSTLLPPGHDSTSWK